MRKKLSDLLVRFRDLVLQYGVIAIIVHYVIFAIVIVAFWAAMRAGWRPTSAVASVSTWTAAYLATKVTQPLRIVATLGLTPLIARLYERFSGRTVRAQTNTGASSTNYKT